MTKKILALLLSVLLIVGVLPVSALAAEPVCGLAVSGSLNADSTVLELSFNVAGTTGSVESGFLVFSYDSSVLVPCAYETGTPVEITDGYQTKQKDDAGLFASADGFNTVGVKGAVKSNRTGLYYNFMKMGGANLTASGINLGSIKFKFVSGKSAANLNKKSFQLETEYADGTFLYQFAGGKPANAAALMLLIGSNKFLARGNGDPDDMNVTSFTYPGMNNVTLTSFGITGNASVNVPAKYGPSATTTAATVTLTAKAYDEFEEEITTFPAGVSWTLENALDGVSISGSGSTATLTVAPGAAAGTARVKISKGAASGTKDVTVTRGAETGVAVEIFRSGDTTALESDTLVIPPASATGDAATTKQTYTAKVYSAYGPIADKTPTWTVTAVEPASNPNVTVTSGGEVSVPKTALKGTVKLKADYNSDYTGLNKEIVLTLTDMEVTNWPAESAVKESIVYGTANSGFQGTGFSTSGGRATAGPTNLEGTFSIKNADTKLTPTDNTTVVVVFTVTTDNAYKGAVVEKEYTGRKVTKKPVTVAIKNQSKVYGAAAIGLTPVADMVTVPANTYVGEDTITDLGVTLACAGDSTSAAAGTLPITGSSTSTKYDVSFTNGTLTINKASVASLAAVTPKASILANSANNDTEAALKTYVGLPSTIEATLDSGKKENLAVTWSMSPAFDRKGKEYTFTGTVSGTANINAPTTAPTVKQTVTPVHIDGILGLEGTVTVAKASVAGAADLAALGVPASVSVFYHEDGVPEPDSVTAKYDKTLKDVQDVAATVGANSGKKSITLTLKGSCLPAWATAPAVLPYITLEITNKFVIPADDITISDITVTYGDDYTPSAKVATKTGYDDTVTKEYSYKNAEGNVIEKPTQAGVYSMVVNAYNDEYEGSKSAVLIITAKPLDASMIAAIDAVTYDKKAHEPELTVTYKGETLKKGVDYTVSYEDNVAAGTAAKAIITAVEGGNFSGTATKNFTINKASLADMKPEIKGTPEVGKVLTAELTGVADSELTWAWKVGGTTVGTDKTFLITAAQSNKNITVEITAKNVNYSNADTITSDAVTVAKQSIGGAISLNHTDTNSNNKLDATDTVAVVKTGITPSEAVSASLEYEWYLDGEKQTETGDTYTVQTGDADKTLKVVVKGKGDFEGSLEASVEVGKSTLAGSPSVTPSGSVPAAVGDTLTLTPGLTAGTSENYDVVWTRDGEVIPDATELTYTIAKDDQGKTIAGKLVGKGAYTGELVASGVAVSAAKPDKPVISASGSNGTVNVSWTAPADNGSTITGYTLTITGPDNYTETVTVSPDSTSYSFTDLTNGEEYSVTMVAANAKGNSDPSDAATATPRMASSGGPASEVETTTGADGSTITTETASDGTVTTTTTWPDGKASVAVVTPVGDVSIKVTAPDGEVVAEVDIPGTVPSSGKKYDDVKDNDWFEENVYKTTDLGLFSGISATDFGPQMNLNRGMLVTVLYRLSGEPDYGTDANIFPDVAESVWYADAADWANAVGVAAGTGTGFAPAADITRQDMVAMIYRYVKAIGKNPAATGSLNRFNDSSRVSDYAREAMQWAVGAGIISGKGNGVLDPKGSATRAEVATVMAKLVDYLKK